MRAVPSEGAANEALRRLVADACGVARSRVTVTAGAKSRIKTVEVAGDPDALGARIGALLGAGGPIR